MHDPKTDQQSHCHPKPIKTSPALEPWGGSKAASKDSRSPPPPPPPSSSNMDFVSLLKEKIEERQDESFDLLPVLVQNWVVFQRSTFDYLDENDEPFTTQIFLIEVCTGRYVHRTHGVRIDFGVTLDLDVLAGKLVEAFVGTKVCHGLPVKHDEVHPGGRLTRQEYPYPRLVSRECVHWYQAYKREGIADGDVDESRRSVCPACQKAKRGGDDLSAEEETGQELKVETGEIIQTLLPKAEADVSEETPSLDWIADDILKDLKGHESEDSDASYQSSSLDRVILDETEESDTAVKPCGRKRRKVAKSNETPVRTHKKNLKCNHCFQVFPSTTVYHRHQREKRQVGCKQCNKKVVTFGDLRKHLAKKHPESYDGPFKSLWENDEDEETMLKPRACFRCDRVFNGAVLLYRHKEFYHELGDYKCSDCQEPCLTFYDLIIHNYRKHSKAIAHVAPYTRGLEVIVDKDGKVEKKRTLFACHLCPETFTMDCTYTHHMRKYHAWGLFECIACDEVGHYAGEVSAHMVNFHRDNPEVKCPNCSSVVSLREDDDEFLHHYESCKHVWSTSGKKKSRNKDFVEKLTFQCHFCGKNYASKFILDAHIKVHQGIEQFKCSYCDYGTNVKSALKEHEQYHMREQGLTNDESGVQLYHYCDQCGQKFTRPSYVRVHKKRVHDGVKLILECKDCSPCETFRSKKMLYKHKREKHGYVPVKRTKVGRRPLD